MTRRFIFASLAAVVAAVSLFSGSVVAKSTPASTNAASCCAPGAACCVPGAPCCQ